MCIQDWDLKILLQKTSTIYVVVLYTNEKRNECKKVEKKIVGVLKWGEEGSKSHQKIKKIVTLKKKFPLQHMWAKSITLFPLLHLWFNITMKKIFGHITLMPQELNFLWSGHFQMVENFLNLEFWMIIYIKWCQFWLKNE